MTNDLNIEAGLAESAQEQELTPTGAVVNNPVGFYKSEAEKYARILRNTEKSVSELKATVEQQNSVLQASNSRLSEMESQLEAERQNRLTELKKNVLLLAGLSIELTEFITATDDEGVKTQVGKLAEKIGTKPKVAPLTRVGNSNALPGQTSKPEWLDSRNSDLGGGYKINE